MSSVSTPVDTGAGIRTVDDDFDLDLSDWYCIATNPFPCPCGEFMAHHMTAVHRVIIFPDNDGDDILFYAEQAKKANRNPKIVEYEKSFGPYITMDQLRAERFPAHRKIPDGD